MEPLQSVQLIPAPGSPLNLYAYELDLSFLESHVME